MKTRVRISDHALVRYTERVLGMDLQPLRDQIARELEEALERGGDLDGATAVIAGGFRFVLEGQTVVTIHAHNRPDQRTGCVRDKRPDRDA